MVSLVAVMAAMLLTTALRAMMAFKNGRACRDALGDLDVNHDGVSFGRRAATAQRKKLLLRLVVASRFLSSVFGTCLGAEVLATENTRIAEWLGRPFPKHRESSTGRKGLSDQHRA